MSTPAPDPVASCHRRGPRWHRHQLVAKTRTDNRRRTRIRRCRRTGRPVRRINDRTLLGAVT